MLNVVVSGIVTGLLYAVAGLGLVIVYRTSKVLNFAMGGIGAIAAYTASLLLASFVPYWLVFPLTLLAGAGLGLLIEITVARPLQHRPPLTIAIATLGALLVLQGALGARIGYSPRALPEALASAPGVHAGGFGVSANQLLIIAVAVTVTLAVFLLIYRTRLGLTMRAASSGQQTAELLGVNVSMIRLIAWMVGGAYGALAALLITPLTYLTPSSFTGFVLTAFAAVVLGGFTSIGGVVIGAVCFGVAINLLETSLSPTLIDTYTFIGIALVLFLRPHGLFGTQEHEIPEPPIRVIGSGGAVPIAPERRGGAATALLAAPGRTALATRWVPWLVLLVVLALAPSLLGKPDQFLLIVALSAFIGILGLNILVGYTGQVSLGHSAFLAIGAIVASVASAHGVNAFLALPLALVGGALAGLLIGLPAGRLSGIYLALLTLAFSFSVPELDMQFTSITGGSNGLPLSLPPQLATAESQYWFVLAVAALVTAVTLIASESRLGRGWRAVRDSEPAARALGLNPTAIKLGAFAWSSGLGALSGAIGGMVVGFVTPGTYGVFVSIYALLAVVLGGPGSVFGSLLGALFITAVPVKTQAFKVPEDLVFGLVMAVTLLAAPNGISGLLHLLLVRVRALVPGLRPRRQAAPAASGSASLGELEAAADKGPQQAEHKVLAPASGPPPAGLILLELRGVSAGYGLVDVLHQASLEVRRGEVVALIGANGAGKSTLLRTVSGQIRPSRGSVYWRGHEIASRTPPYRHARIGIGHVPEGRAIFPDLTVAENLSIGQYGTGGRREGGLSVEQVLDRFPVLLERARQRAGTLSGGQQQVLAIGRALVGRPELLMLDEPSLGLAPIMTQQVFDILRTIAAMGVSVLLVEQNAQAALELADRAYVMSRGRIVLEGTSQELRDDDRIRQTYLGVSGS